MTSADDVLALFRDAFGQEPRGVWSSPGRVNLIGEHTDYTGGFVMPLAVGQRAFVAVRPRADGLVRAVAHGRGEETVRLDEVGRGNPGSWLAYLAGAAKVAAPDSGQTGGWDIALASDVPVGAGLSSSAAITCATLLAIDEVGGGRTPRLDLAYLAQRVEHEIVGVPCGIMDQAASLLCEPDHLLFLDTRSMSAAQVPWPGSAAGLALLVTDTRAPHTLADGQYARRRLLCEQATAVLGVTQLRDATLVDLEAADGLTREQEACARHVISENDRVLQVRALLDAGDYRGVGPLLTASHASLRDDFVVTVPQLDTAVDAALAAGALGARMTGGGFGGCTITLVREDDVDGVRSAIDLAFAAAGFGPPVHFLAHPSGGGRREV